MTMSTDGASSSSDGLTWVEVAIVVVIIGIVVCIAVPNFVGMQRHARDVSVKNNMHMFQLACEDFAVLHDGRYPSFGDSSVVYALLPYGVVPDNPWTKNRTRVFWSTSYSERPLDAGDISITTARDGYRIRGGGRRQRLHLELSN